MAHKEEKVDHTRIIEYGSEEHARMLGLIKGEDGGYELEDPTPYIQIDPSGRLEEHILQQKINELTKGIPEPQSEDPTKPGYAPPLWVPPSA